MCRRQKPEIEVRSRECGGISEMGLASESEVRLRQNRRDRVRSRGSFSNTNLTTVTRLTRHLTSHANSSHFSDEAKDFVR